MAALVVQGWGLRRVAKELGLPLGSASKLVRWANASRRPISWAELACGLPRIGVGSLEA